MRTHLRANKKVTDGAMATMLDGLQCGYTCCNQPATTLLIERPPFQRQVFACGAGICCNDHAQDAQRGGKAQIVTGGSTK